MRIKPLILFCTLATLSVAHADELVSPPMVPSPSTPVVAPQQQVGVIDTVLVVVNNDVITRHELDEKTQLAIRQLTKQGTPLPPQDILEKQVLERMITDMLQLQFAQENGIRVEDAQLDFAINRIAQQNNFASVSDFRNKLTSEGLDWNKFREEIRHELLLTRVREREIESKLIISDAEVDRYLENKKKMGNTNEEFHLAHILISVPEQANAGKIQASRNRAEQAWNMLQGGADFAQVAAGYSDAKDALKGGDIGWRSGDRLPPQFLELLHKLQAGQHSQVIRSPAGFHILKMIEKRSGDAPVVITQTHARHILIKTSEIMPDAEAKKRIQEIKAQIDKGLDFAEAAKRYSEDGSAPKGGDLDWLSPGQTVGEFDEMLNKLAIGETGMVQTQFGWHLLQVLARRNTDISTQQQRQQARVTIGTFKSDEQYQDWVRQLRDRAYIDYRVEGMAP